MKTLVFAPRRKVKASGYNA